MKEFNDFLVYLKQESTKEPDFPVFAKTYMLDSMTPENLTAFMAQYSEDILRAANVLTMYYLKAYHEWLSEQNQ